MNRCHVRVICNAPSGEFCVVVVGLFLLNKVLCTVVVTCEWLIKIYGFRLRPIDIEAMKRLVKVVNVIPVIAKADSLTIDERERFKKVVSKSIFTYPHEEQRAPT